MAMTKKEVEQRMRQFEQVCRDAGVKLTHQRLEIYREISQTGDHPDAKLVFQRVKKRVSTISLDTVYRALWLFNDLGLIKTLGASRERTRFDANLEQHHHFVCGKCGLTSDFYSEDLNELKLPDSMKIIGHPATTHVEVRGICIECAAKKKTIKTQGGKK